MPIQTWADSFENSDLMDVAYTAKQASRASRVITVRGSNGSTVDCSTLQIWNRSDCMNQLDNLREQVLASATQTAILKCEGKFGGQVVMADDPGARAYIKNWMHEHVLDDGYRYQHPEIRVIQDFCNPGYSKYENLGASTRNCLVTVEISCVVNR